MKDVNNSLSAKKLEDLINEQNLLIFDEENWINKDLWKIAEVTYSYDEETKINTTLFVMGGGLDIKKYKKSKKEERKKLLEIAKTKLIQLLNSKKSQIEIALQEIELIDIFSGDTVETDIKRIFINSLIEKNDFIDYCINGLNYELEKAGYENILSAQQEKEINEKQYILDTKLFGGNIKNNPEETILAYEYLIGKYNKNKDKLSKIEQELLAIYIKKIIDYIPNGYIYKEKIKPIQIEGDYLNYDIKRKDYMLGFNILIESLDKLKHVAESNDSAKSISDGPKGIQFPTTKDFDSIKILRFFKLGNHEIETHNITDYNGRQIIGNLRGANSTEKDEGVSVLMEQLFMYGKELYKTDNDGNIIIDIKKVQINSNFTKTLMGEILNNNELLKFLELSNIIDPDVISPNDRFFRLKRNNKAGVQHKDTTYTRGLLKAVNEINQFIKSKGKKGINPKDLFIGKISFDETSKLKRIKFLKEKSGKSIKTVKPLFISDTVHYIIKEKLKGHKANIKSEKFYNFLQDKYSIFNLSYEEIRGISYKTKRNVIGIVNILIKTIGEHQIHSLKEANKKAIDSVLSIWSYQYEPRIESVKKKLSSHRRNAK